MFAGSIRRDHELRTARLKEMFQITSKVDGLSPKPIVIVGPRITQLLVYLDAEQRANHTYVYFIENDQQIIEYRKSGYDVVYLPGLARRNMAVHQVDIERHGARPLFGSDR
jgi:hypothetical protein